MCRLCLRVGCAMLTLKHSIISFCSHLTTMDCCNCDAPLLGMTMLSSSKAVKARAFLAPTGLKHCAVQDCTFTEVA